MLKIATDFSGIGSPEEALKRLQVDYSVAFACDIDRFAKASYLANHYTENFYDDIIKRDNDKAPGSDLYCFGFPCQAFSISGKRLGFEDTRGTLFFNALEYISKQQPRVFIAENVKGLLSHDKQKGSKSKYGKTFGVIRDALGLTINGQHNLYKYEDCVNYHIHFQVLNTKDYGLPQNRERIFIVGFRNEADSVLFKFPKKLPLQLKLKDLLEKNVDEKYYLSEAALNRLLKRGDDLENDNDVAKVITTTNQQSNLSFKNNGTLISDELELSNSRTRIAKSTDSISPCIMANQAKQSTDSILINEVDQIEKKQVIVVNDNGELKEMDILNCIDANYAKGMDNHAQRSMILEDEPIIGAIRGRNIVDGKRKDYFGAPTQQRIEINENGISNCLTSVQKDNIVIEHEMQSEDSILFDKENTAKGYTQANPGDSINYSNPNSTTRRGRVGKQIAQTLDAACNQAILLPLFESQNNADAERIYDAEGIARTLKSEGGGAFNSKRMFSPSGL